MSVHFGMGPMARHERYRNPVAEEDFAQQWRADNWSFDCREIGSWRCCSAGVRRCDDAPGETVYIDIFVVQLHLFSCVVFVRSVLGVDTLRRLLGECTRNKLSWMAGAGGGSSVRGGVSASICSLPPSSLET